MTDNKYENLKVIYKQEHKELYELKKHLIILSHKYFITDGGSYVTLEDISNSPKVDTLQGLEREIKLLESSHNDYPV